MNYYDMKREFLKVAKYSRYASELNNFEQAFYLQGHIEITLDLLQRLSSNDIKDSLVTLVDKKQYNSKSIASKYMTVMAQFFRFCMRNKWFQNNQFLKEINAPSEDKGSSYLYVISQYIKGSDDLKSVSQITPLDEDELDSIIEYIDGVFDNAIFPTFDKYAALLGIKIMLFTGVKIGSLYNLKLTDVDLNQNTFYLNDYQIRMPLEFAKQLRFYIDRRPHTSAPELFLNRHGSPWKGLTSSKIDNALETVFYRSDTTCLTKYGIRQLILAGTDIQTLENLTQAGPTIIRSCIFDTDFIKSEQTRNIYLLRQMTRTDIFHLC